MCNAPKPDVKVKEFDLKHYADSVSNKAHKEEREKAILEGIMNVREVEVTKWKDRWHKAKHDTIPCEEKLPLVIETCDSLIASKDSAMISCKRLNTKNDSIIKHRKQIRWADSSNVERLTNKVDSLKPRQYLFVGGSITTGGNVFPSVGFDTRKGLFTAGYDPFAKQFKVGGYFKIKLWKRR